MPRLPLNDQQLKVLRWIQDGCPEGTWTDSTFKTSAVALRNRHLIRISKKGGGWQAELTDDGRSYLTHGSYPDGARAARPTAEATPSTEPSHPDHPHQAAGPPEPGEPSAAQLLVDRVVAAGGRLEVETEPFAYGPAHDVSAVNQQRMAPAGQILRSLSRGSRVTVVYLATDPATVVMPREIVVPTRVRSLHPAALAYRDEQDYHEVSPQTLSRAVRIVNALGRTAEAAGIAATAPPREGRSGEIPRGQLRFQRAGFEEWVRIQEIPGAGGEPQPYYYGQRARRLPAWQARRTTKFVPTGRLMLSIGQGYAQDGRQARFRDTGRNQLEGLLPQVLGELEMRALRHDQRIAEIAAEDEIVERQCSGP